MLSKIQYYLLYIVLSFVILCSSCLVQSTKVQSLEPQRINSSYETKEMVKAHLYDGSVILFHEGFKVFRENNQSILQANGTAMQYDFIRSDSSAQRIYGIEFSKVAALEIYPHKGEPGSFVAAIPLYAVGGTVLGVAIFGSCPTYYTVGANGKEVLHGEGFSYSISPRSEKEDIDKITNPIIDSEGKLQLIVKNEALETHYINQLQIQQVQHDKNSIALPTDSKGISPKKKQHILIMGKENAVVTAKNSQGKNILSHISKADTAWYRTPIEITEKAVENPQTRDWVELEIANPEEKSTLYLGIKLRNTLLNSIFLYDMLLGNQGFNAIDWVAKKSNNIPYLLRFNKYYQQYFGLPIEVFQNGKWKQIDRLADQGPIAWSYRGLALNVPREKTIKLRLKFLPDNWMIDWVSASFEGKEKANFTLLNVANIFPAKTAITKENVMSLLKDSKKHVITNPGEVYRLNFKPVSNPDDQQSSFFIYSKGYYIEWLRNDWLTDSSKDSKDLVLDESLIRDLFAQWLVKKNSFEKDFFSSKINPDSVN